MSKFSRRASHLCFEVFANELRFNIIRLLFEKERAVLDIASLLNVEQSRVSHALNVLKQCNFVKVKKHGKQRIYFIPDNIRKMFSLDSSLKAENIFDLMGQHIARYCKTCHRSQELEKNVEV